MSNLIQEKIEEVLTWPNNNPNTSKNQFDSKIWEFGSVLNHKKIKWIYFIKQLLFDY